ncbi:respiratory nitrate reductase subunit gamma [Abyssicoccus albus]|uniref:respiratory nitrate reductase subunit gamma n=1 Tax=Abyssicoccus albus TaxID=1817405 RepID=UPI00097E3D23|nr:respiratory nitrate reductase subunit gamma [Abyssicoccus albus]AQL56882.1 respiratory nitrate reductase subunit gamma [Abyssicoccus albus]
MLEQLLWVIFPYIAIVVFIFGHIKRYKDDQFHWTAKSSEFIEKKQLKWGSLLFHLGIVPVFFGHVVGLLIPASWLSAIGINDHMYHLGAVYIGSIFGFMTLIGMFLLTYRRISKASVLRLSSASDIIVNIMLLIIVFVGCYATVVTNFTTPEFDYRSTISVWVRGLLTLSPQAELMREVPMSFKIHVLLGFAIIMLWPFTRLVHVWSVPTNYGTRSYILYRKHAPRN